MYNRNKIIKFASSHPSDISEHLLQIYDTVVANSPKIIIELGVRTGMSTFALSRAAQDVGAILISVDIEDCSKYCDWNKWKFVQMDDLDFADRFNQNIDILFVDTDHAFRHTVSELKKFLPKMNKKGVIIVHDTNIQDPVIRSRVESRVGGDIRVGNAIDLVFGIRGNWKTNFETDTNNAKIVNYAHNNGMTFIFLK